jgi:hypothetical protein
LPAFHFGADFVLGHGPVRLSFEIILSAQSSKTPFDFSECAPVVLLVLPGLRLFIVFVGLINFWQHIATILLSLL